MPQEFTRVADGSEATLYWRMYQAGYNTSPLIGFVAHDYEYLEADDEENPFDRPVSFDPIGWPDFRLVMRAQSNPRRNEFIEAWDDNDYRLLYYETDNGFELVDFPAGEWWEFWIHINNGPGAVLDEYSMYVRPLNGEQKRLWAQSPADPEMFFDTFLFRGMLDGDLLRLRLTVTSGPPANRFAGDVVLWDDFYFDETGINLTRPENVSVPDSAVEVWNGLVIKGSPGPRYVDFGINYLGEMFIDHEPWLYSRSLNAWIMHHAFTARGVWTYIPYVNGESILPEPVWGSMVLSDPEDPESDLVEGPKVWGYDSASGLYFYTIESADNGGQWVYFHRVLISPLQEEEEEEED